MKIDDIVNETDSYRAELCRQVQNDSGVDCVMLEKDIWVTYVLEKIFADQKLSRILRFKGGTCHAGYEVGLCGDAKYDLWRVSAI